MMPIAALTAQSDAPSARGFTLLELIIVLSVMVGLLAVVWPNLQRPLQRTSLDEGAQIVRDAIDESRYQSSLRGTPYFVHLQAGKNYLRTADFDSFLAAGTGGFGAEPATAETGSSEADNPQLEAPTGKAATIRVWKLPRSVVISGVDSTLRSVLPESSGDRSKFVDAAGLVSDQSGTDAADTAVQADAVGEAASVLDSVSGFDNGQQWWLPLTAEGRGRDAVIELFDSSVNQHLRVIYSAATGSLEISR